ncbi:MAG: pilin [Caldimonas sp.]
MPSKPNRMRPTMYAGLGRVKPSASRVFSPSCMRITNPPTIAYPRRQRCRRRSGFTLIELMVVVGIVAILALVALPGIPDRVVRDQIIEAVKLTDIAKAPIAATWAVAGRLPVNNAEAGLPAADRIVSNYISSVSVESGAIQVTFGNQANGVIRGKTLTLRPGVIEDSAIVPVSWVCGDADPPRNMVARGLNKTNVPARYLPLNCRRSVAPPAVG